MGSSCKQLSERLRSDFGIFVVSNNIGAQEKHCSWLMASSKKDLLVLAQRARLKT